MRVTLFAAAVLLACTGPAGPRGEPGYDGLDGEDGKDGRDGRDGAPGKDGADGEDGADADETRIVESFGCNGTLSGTEIGYSYDAILMSTGDLYVAGSIRDARVSSTKTAFYAPTQKGWATAAVIVGIDTDATSNFGYYVLQLDRRTPLVLNIDYYAEDVGTQVTPQKWIYGEVCVHNFY